MQHANLPSVALVADIEDEEAVQGRLRPMGQRSARTELAMRELAKLQAQAARLAAVIEADDGMEPCQGGPAAACTERDIRAILQARLERKSFFSEELFADPAWDMLLDLYAAELGQVRVSVTSLCIASNSPTSTALRWISSLESERLIERRPDPLDGRRFFISLTRDAIDRFERYFAAKANRAVI